MGVVVPFLIVLAVLLIGWVLVLLLTVPNADADPSETTTEAGGPTLNTRGPDV